MSSATHSLSTPRAPWAASFEEHLAKMPSPEFVLATVTPTPGSMKSATTSYLPRARFCIYRGMWATLPENKHNDAPRNPRVYESDMPTFTTDVRMHKVEELFTTSAGKAESREQTLGSGGGGPVEAVFWNKDVGTQWRIRGTAWVVDSSDIDETRGDIPGKVTSGVRAVKSEIGRRMRIVQGKESEIDQWTWGREVTGHFGNCSPGMRGSWKNPTPGSPTNNQGPPDKEHELGQKVTDLEDPLARANFRVVIIKPDEVESTDLSDPKSSRRQLYKFVVDESKGEEGERVGVWQSEELWP